MPEGHWGDVASTRVSCACVFQSLSKRRRTVRNGAVVGFFVEAIGGKGVGEAGVGGLKHFLVDWIVETLQRPRQSRGIGFQNSAQPLLLFLLMVLLLYMLLSSGFSGDSRGCEGRAVRTGPVKTWCDLVDHVPTNCGFIGVVWAVAMEARAAVAPRTVRNDGNMMWSGGDGGVGYGGGVEKGREAGGK